MIILRSTMIDALAKAAAAAYESPPGQTAEMRDAMWRSVAIAVLDAQQEFRGANE